MSRVGTEYECRRVGFGRDLFCFRIQKCRSGAKLNGTDSFETPSKPANELEGLIRDKLPDPVRRHLIDVIIDRTDADGLAAPTVGFGGAPFVVCFWAEDDWSSAKSNTAILMLHLFVATPPFEGSGEYPYDGASLSQLLAVLIVIVRSLVVILAGDLYGAGPVFP